MCAGDMLVKREIVLSFGAYIFDQTTFSFDTSLCTGVGGWSRWTPRQDVNRWIHRIRMEDDFLYETAFDYNSFGMNIV